MKGKTRRDPERKGSTVKEEGGKGTSVGGGRKKVEKRRRRMHLSIDFLQAPSVEHQPSGQDIGSLH